MAKDTIFHTQIHTSWFVWFIFFAARSRIRMSWWKRLDSFVSLNLLRPSKHGQFSSETRS